MTLVQLLAGIYVLLVLWRVRAELVELFIAWYSGAAPPSRRQCALAWLRVGLWVASAVLIALVALATSGG